MDRISSKADHEKRTYAPDLTGITCRRCGFDFAFLYAGRICSRCTAGGPVPNPFDEERTEELGAFLDDRSEANGQPSTADFDKIDAAVQGGLDKRL